MGKHTVSSRVPVILQVFFSIHDPTTLNRQGSDIGTQYRSVIYFHDIDQKITAEKIINQLEADGIWENPIITELAQFERFYLAEDYHQKYYLHLPIQPE